MCGNLMCPYIINLIGMGLGLTVWDLSNMIMGWFTGEFGLFGVQKEHHTRPLANCVGLGLALASLIFFSLAVSCDAQGMDETRQVHVVKNAGAKAASPVGKKSEDGPDSEMSQASTTSSETFSADEDLEIQEPESSPKSIRKEPDSDGLKPAPCQSSSARDFVVGFSMALFAGFIP